MAISYRLYRPLLLRGHYQNEAIVMKPIHKSLLCVHNITPGSIWPHTQGDEPLIITACGFLLYGPLMKVSAMKVSAMKVSVMKVSVMMVSVMKVTVLVQSSMTSWSR